MRHAVLKFPASAEPRPDPHPDATASGVRAIIALAPVLGRRHPEAVPNVEHLMRALIGTDDPGRGERLPPRRRRAAKARLPVPVAPRPPTLKPRAAAR